MTVVILIGSRRRAPRWRRRHASTAGGERHALDEDEAAGPRRLLVEVQDPLLQPLQLVTEDPDAAAAPACCRGTAAGEQGDATHASRRRLDLGVRERIHGDFLHL